MRSRIDCPLMQTCYLYLGGRMSSPSRGRSALSDFLVYSNRTTHGECAPMTSAARPRPPIPYAAADAAVCLGLVQKRFGIDQLAAISVYGQVCCLRLVGGLSLSLSLSHCLSSPCSSFITSHLYSRYLSLSLDRSCLPRAARPLRRERLTQLSIDLCDGATRCQ